MAKKSEMENDPQVVDVVEMTREGREKVVGARTEGVLRTVQDGGHAGENLPLVREGEVYESLGSETRRVKVLSVVPDEEGRVLVQNISSFQNSRIRVDRLQPEGGWRRYAS